ncbi:MAG: hypothetical protein IBX57_02930 [Gammaproteobacteria bacterium]|nr:hypothetical protein [Gammaproteobacteria bacterium]
MHLELKQAVGAILALSFTSSVQSHDLGPDHDGWQFRLTPYVWGAGMDGRVAQFGLPTTHISQSFGEVLDNLKLGGMLAVEARKDRFGLLADVLHVRLGESGQAVVPAPPAPIPGISVKARASVNLTTALFAGQYRTIDMPQGYLDLIAGVRHWSVNTRITISSQALGVNLSGQESESWNDAMVGAKALYKLDDRFYTLGMAMIGGFGSNVRSSSDIMLGLGYSLNDRAALLLSYRHLAVDYRKSDFVYDTRMHGPGIGLDYRF